MTDVVIKYSTSGLGETLKSVDQIAQAQKSLEQFLKAASKAYQAQGQDAKTAANSAKEFAASNNITAASFQGLIARQKEVELGAKAIAQTLKLQAQVTKELEQANSALARSVGDTGSRFEAIKGAFSGNARAATEAVNAYKQLASEGNNSGKIQAELASKLGITGTQFAALRSNVENSKSSLQGFSGIAQGVGIQIAQFAANLANKVFIEFPKTAIQTAAAFQGIKLGLDAVSGGTKEGAKNFEFVKAEAQRLGLELKQSEQNFLQLTAAAQGTKLAGKPIQELFSAISGAQRVLGSSTEQQGRALLALQQVISKGTLSSEELRQQLGEALPGAYQIAARSLGLTAAELNKQLQAGAISATEFIPKFTEQLNKEFGGGIDAAAQGSLANLQKVTNLTTILAAAFGEKLLPVINEFLEVIGANAEGLEEFTNQAGELTAKVLGVLSEVLKESADDSTLLGSSLKTLKDDLEGFSNALQAIKDAGNTFSFIGDAVKAADDKLKSVGVTSKELGSGLVENFAPVTALGNVLNSLTASLNAAKFDKLTTDTTKAGDSALVAANHTKALSEALKASGQATTEQIANAEAQLKTNEGIVEGLTKQLEAAKKQTASNDEQRTAKAQLIGQLQGEIKAVTAQTDALDASIRKEKESGETKGLSKQQIKDKVAELKKETSALKEKNREEESSTIAEIKRQQDRDKADRKNLEEKDIKKDQTKETNEVKALEKSFNREQAEEKKRTERELKQDQKQFDAEQAKEKKRTNLEIAQDQKQFDREQADEKKRTEQELKADQKQFDREQATERKRTERELAQDKKAFDKEISADQKKVEQQLKLEDPSLSAADKAKAVKDFAKEEALAKRRAELEAPIEAKKEAFEAKQLAQKEASEKALQESKDAFEEAQNQKRAAFEDALRISKDAFEEEQNQKKAIFEDALAKSKDAFEEIQNQKRTAFEEALAVSKDKFEADIQARKEAFEEKLNNRKKAFEDNERNIAESQAKALETRRSAFNASQRALDEESAKRIAELKKTPSQAPTTPPPTTSENIRQNIQGRLVGGSVDSNTPYIVGEKEAELFVPNVDGTILNQQQAFENIRLLEKVGQTKFDVNAARMNVNQPSDLAGLMNEVKTLRKTVEDRDQTIEFPVMIKNEDTGYKQLDQMLKLQFAVLRSRI